MSLASQRKDDHLRLYKNSQALHNDFDRVRLLYHSLPHYNLDDIDLQTSYCGYTLSCPFYINAITGGSKKAAQINEKLAHLAKACDLFLASGSYAIALKEPQFKADFLTMRQIHEKGLFACNLGVDKSPDLALKALEETKADVLQIHLNALQELLMPEGNTQFSSWREHLKTLVERSPKPLLVKEVGFGMSESCLEELLTLGIRYIDISGQGGTNFAQIEQARQAQPPSCFSSEAELSAMGFSTVESLLFAQKFKGQACFYASGGIRKAGDIVKALALGADAVGLSAVMLDLVEHHSLEQCISIVEQWKKEIKQFFCMLNVKNIQELHQKKCYLLKNPMD